MEDRNKIGNGKSSMLKCPPNYAPADFSAFLTDLKAGTVYVDITPNDATTGSDVGVYAVGTPLNKANLLSDETAEKIGMLASDAKTPNNAVSILQDNIDDVDDNVTALKTIRTATFPANGWQGSSAPYTQSVAVVGLDTTDNPSYDLYIDPTSISTSDAVAKQVAFNCITTIAINSGSITAYCFQTKPITEFSIVLKGE